MLKGNLRLLILRVGSPLKLSLLGWGIRSAEGAFMHALTNVIAASFWLFTSLAWTQTVSPLAPSEAQVPESTNTPAGIHTDASLGLPRRYAMAPVLRDLSHEPEFLFLDGAAY